MQIVVQGPHVCFSGRSNLVSMRRVVLLEVSLRDLLLPTSAATLPQRDFLSTGALLRKILRSIGYWHCKGSSISSNGNV